MDKRKRSDSGDPEDSNGVLRIRCRPYGIA